MLISRNLTIKKEPEFDDRADLFEAILKFDDKFTYDIDEMDKIIKKMKKV